MKKSKISTQKKNRFSWIFKEICVQKYLYTFVFSVPSGPTHLLLYKSILCTFVFLGPFGTHPTPYTSGTFVMPPPPFPEEVSDTKKCLESITGLKNALFGCQNFQIWPNLTCTSWVFLKWWKSWTMLLTFLDVLGSQLIKSHNEMTIAEMMTT